MTSVKICGITREDDLETAAEGGADMIGFVVETPNSPRNLENRYAKELISSLPETIGSVAVTIFTSTNKLKQLVDNLEPDYIQLHGNFIPSLNSIKKAIPSERIIGTVNALGEDALKKAVRFSNLLETVLLDSNLDSGLGGTGLTHNWALSRKIKDAIKPRRLVLAGGLTPENVADAVRTVKPYGVDVSSGVEKKPGIKDHDKVIRFIAEAKGVET